jgi:sulfur-carrier protein
MPNITFTPNIQRHVQCPDMRVTGATVREALDAVFRANPKARGYVLDDQGALRRHMAIFVDGEMIRDREKLSEPVAETSTIAVFQALSGG